MGDRLQNAMTKIAKKDGPARSVGGRKKYFCIETLGRHDSRFEEPLFLFLHLADALDSSPNQPAVQNFIEHERLPLKDYVKLHEMGLDAEGFTGDVLFPAGEEVVDRWAAPYHSPFTTDDDSPPMLAYDMVKLLMLISGIFREGRRPFNENIIGLIR